MERIHYGIHSGLEEAANELLRQAVAPLPRSEKTDVLTPWKERDRYSKEVYTRDGVPDAAIRSGMYSRAWNPQSPHLNSRPGASSTRRTEEATAYFPEKSYRDRAGKVVTGWIRRSIQECRTLTWGNQRRLQCVPCRRYLAAGPSPRCRRCGTTYVDDREPIDV